MGSDFIPATRPPQSPTQPLNLTATPNGDVVHTTIKAKTTLTGYTPGTNFKFRVRASKNDISTLPSNVAEIYPSGSDQVQLQVAA